ncbi:MAG: lasso RiPP family leader peptide-containing protein [Thermoleophilia bacterium]
MNSSFLSAILLSMKSCKEQYEKPILDKIGNLVDLTRVDPGLQSSVVGGSTKTQGDF